MEIIPQLISRYSIVLYAVCGIACAYFLLTGVASLRELRRAVFRLERNAVVSRTISALLKAALCLLGAAGIYGISTMAPAPAENSLLGEATSTPSGIVIPTSMPTAVITSGQALAGMSVTPTIVFLDAAGNTVTPDPAQVGGLAATQEFTTAVTLTPIEVTAEVPAADLATNTPEVQSTSSPELMTDCSSPSAQITNPVPDEEVKGIYTVLGTAVLETGGWYQLEILPQGSAQWAMIGRGDATVTGGVLFENFNATAFAPGAYPLRLVLLGPDGGIRAICRIPMTIGPSS